MERSGPDIDLAVRMGIGPWQVTFPKMGPKIGLQCPCRPGPGAWGLLGTDFADRNAAYGRSVALGLGNWDKVNWGMDWHSWLGIGIPGRDAPAG